MQRVRICLVTLVLLLMSTSIAHSDFFDIVDQWYDDANLDNVVAFSEKDCDGVTTSWGTPTNYWSHVVYSCSTGQEVSHGCWIWNSSTSSWTSVPCEWNDGRLRIPVG